MNDPGKMASKMAQFGYRLYQSHQSEFQFVHAYTPGFWQKKVCNASEETMYFIGVGVWQLPNRNVTYELTLTFYVKDKIGERTKTRALEIRSGLDAEFDVAAMEMFVDHVWHALGCVNNPYNQGG